MEMRALGRSEVMVSRVCLGTMTFGEQNTEADGHGQMDIAVDHGINFFDAAELYPIPPKPETQGRTEDVIGTWMKARGNRDKVVIATKVVGRNPFMNWFRDSGEEPRLSRAHILEACDKSLKRLQTDYIDLYQLHWPDRPQKYFGYPAPEPSEDEVPIAETLAALGELVAAGKVRQIGLSNESPWGVMQFLNIAEAEGLPRVVSIQNCYNLVTRAFELTLAEFALREDVGLLAYSPLAQGYLTGKYRDGAMPPGSRKALFDRLQRYEGPGAEEAINAYLDLAAEHGLNPTQMALAYCMTKNFITSVIIGATTETQLAEDLGAFDLTLPDEVLAGIDAIHRRHPNPAL